MIRIGRWLREVRDELTIGVNDKLLYLVIGRPGVQPWSTFHRLTGRMRSRRLP